jgi:hypothetical protein
MLEGEEVRGFDCGGNHLVHRNTQPPFNVIITFAPGGNHALLKIAPICSSSLYPCHPSQPPRLILLTVLPRSQQRRARVTYT